MTTAEMLASVEAQIRKDIPRLMELSEGCWIKQKTLEKDFIFKVIAVKNDFFKCVLGFADFIFLAKDIVNSPKSFEIIGHDIMLNDVLEQIFTNKIQPHNVLIFWDFSKPLLKDQPEEVIKFLYNVKK